MKVGYWPEEGLRSECSLGTPSADGNRFSFCDKSVGLSQGTVER